MPERVSLTPLPDSEFRELACCAANDMHVKWVNIEFKDGGKDELTPNHFSQIFAMRFLARLMIWRKRDTLVCAEIRPRMEKRAKC